MFNHQQIKMILTWSMQLGLDTVVKETLASSDKIKIKSLEFKVEDLNNLDMGVNFTLLFFILEELIPNFIKKALERQDKMPVLEGFNPFISWLSLELLKQHQAVISIQQLTQRKALKEDIQSRVEKWCSALKDTASWMMDFAQAVAIGNQEGLRDALIAWQKDTKTFQQATKELNKISEKYFEEVTKAVLDSSREVYHASFDSLGIQAAPQSIDKKAKNSSEEKQALSQKDAASSSSSTSTPVIQEPRKIDLVRDPKALVERKSISPKKLKHSFETCRYQQFALTGHNLLLSYARPENYESPQKKYIDNLSAVILSQQIMLSHRYTSIMAERIEEDEHFTEENGSEAEKIAIEEILLKAFENIAKESKLPTNTKELVNKLVDAFSFEITKVSPNIASTLTSLRQGQEISFCSYLNNTFSKELPKILSKVQSSPLKPLIDKLGGEEKIQSELKKVTSHDWLKQFDKILNEAPQIIENTLKCYDLKQFDIKEAGELFEKAKGIFETLSGNSASLTAVIDQINGGLGGGTLLDLGGPVMGTAIKEFLPVLSKELFGDGQLGQAATGAMSAAMTGFTVGGPVGAFVGAGISLFSSLLESDEKTREHIEAMADRLEGKMDIISNDIKAYTGACFERMDERIMNRFAHVQETLKQISSDIHENIDILGRHIDDEFKAVFDGIDKLSQEMEVHAVQVHRHLEHLARYNEERFDHLEQTMINVGEVIYNEMQRLHNAQQGQIERLEANLMRAISSVNYNVEQQFLQQKSLLLKLHNIQRQAHAESTLMLEDIKLDLNRLERIARDHRKQTKEQYTKLEEFIKTQEIMEPLKEARRYSMKNVLDEETSEDKLHALADLLDPIDRLEKNLGEKIYLLNRIGQIFLTIFYRSPSLWPNDLIQQISTKFISTALNYYQNAYELPFTLAKQLANYQSTLYEVYHQIINGYLEKLEVKETKPVRGQNFDDESEVADTTSGRGRVASRAYSDWDKYREADNSFSEINYSVGSYSARLEKAQNASAGKVLDALISEETQEIILCIKENNQISMRRFNFGKAVDKAIEAGKAGMKLKDYPILYADYHEVSTSEFNERLLSYRAFVEAYEQYPQFFSCSSQDYAIRYCYHNQASSAKILTWHPKWLYSEITLPEAINTIKIFNALVYGSELIALFVNEVDNSVWIGAWDAKTCKVVEPCKKIDNITIGSDYFKLAPPELLREWSGWLVVANQYLINPKGLMLKSNQLMAEAAFYDNDTSRIRLFNSAKDFGRRGIYYNFEEQAFQSASKFTRGSASKNNGPWVFNGQNLELAWPIELVGISSVELGRQKYLGHQSGYSIYYSDSGKLLLLKDFDKTQYKALHEEADKKIWRDYIPKIQRTWINPIDGALPSDMHLQARMSEMHQPLASLKDNLLMFFQQEFTKNPDLSTSIHLSLSGFDKLREEKTLSSMSNFIAVMRDVLQATAYIQYQLLSSYTKADVVDNSFPMLNHILAVLDKACAFTGASSEIVFQHQQATSAPLGQAYMQAIAMGINFIPSERIEGREAQCVLEIRVYGKSWAEFMASDKLFMERYKEISQHERVLMQLLNHLEQWLIEQGYREKTQTRLFEQLLSNGYKIILCTGTNARACENELSKVIDIKVLTKGQAQQKSITIRPGSITFFKEKPEEARKEERTMSLRK